MYFDFETKTNNQQSNKSIKKTWLKNDVLFICTVQGSDSVRAPAGYSFFGFGSAVKEVQDTGVKIKYVETVLYVCVYVRYVI